MNRELDPLPPEADKVKPGHYEHYKGGRYEAIGVGRHSESLEPVVVYESLDHGSLWARPLGEWLKPLPDGSPRFRSAGFSLGRTARNMIIGALLASVVWLIAVAFVSIYYTQQIESMKFKAVINGAGGYESGEFRLYKFQYVRNEGEKEFRVYRKDDPKEDEK
jgi:hypothetical protein